jgi:hypothetical protein
MHCEKAIASLTCADADGGLDREGRGAVVAPSRATWLASDSPQPAASRQSQAEQTSAAPLRATDGPTRHRQARSSALRLRREKGERRAARRGVWADARRLPLRLRLGLVDGFTRTMIARSDNSGTSR